VRALRYDEFGGPVEVVDIPTPEAPPGGVIVRVAASGLCRSDRFAWAGHDDSVPLPHVPGHEFAGTVAEVGAGVGRWRVGDRVTAPFVNGCGDCEWCRSGQAQVCPFQTQPGFTHDGSHAQYVAVRAADENLVALPEGISDVAAASLGCRFATAYHAVRERAALGEGEWIAVYGAGGVGLSVVQVAHALDARVIAVDGNPRARELAARLGAEHTVGTDGDTPAQIAELTGGGAHVAVDAAGSAATAAAGILSLRRRGRHVQIGLLAPGGTALPLDRVLAWELVVLGSHGMSARDYPGMLELVAAGALRPQDLVTRSVDLGEAASILTSPDRDPEGGGVDGADRAAGPGITVLDPWA
jgi:alcohol dehydrogenase